jgi:hypothetical protein
VSVAGTPRQGRRRPVGPPWTVQIAIWLMAIGGVEAAVVMIGLPVVAILVLASARADSEMGGLGLAFVPALMALAVLAGGIAVLWVSLARGAWRGRTWARVMLTALIAALTPAFAWATTRPANSAVYLLMLQWLLGAGGAAALWLGPSSGHFRRPAIDGLVAGATASGLLARPASLKRAVVLMWAGAALFVSFVVIQAVLSASDLKYIFVAAEALQLCVIPALWAWMALANNRGLAWARIVATVLFGLYTIPLILSIYSLVTRAGAASTAGRPAAHVITINLMGPTWTYPPVTILGYGVAAWATILLWRRSSTEYYSAVSAMSRPT